MSREHRSLSQRRWRKRKGERRLIYVWIHASKKEYNQISALAQDTRRRRKTRVACESQGGLADVCRNGSIDRKGGQGTTFFSPRPAQLKRTQKPTLAFFSFSSFSAAFVSFVFAFDQSSFPIGFAFFAALGVGSVFASGVKYLISLGAGAGWSSDDEAEVEAIGCLLSSTAQKQERKFPSFLPHSRSSSFSTAFFYINLVQGGGERTYEGHILLLGWV